MKVEKGEVGEGGEGGGPVSYSPLNPLLAHLAREREERRADRTGHRKVRARTFSSSIHLLASLQRHYTELERFERFIEDILPVLRSSKFFSLLSVIFLFYCSVILVSVLIIIFSIWV